MNISLEIPIKSYLKKYLEVSFGKEIKLTERSWLGLLVLNLLKRQNFKNKNYEYSPKNYNDSLILTMHLDKMYRHGSVVNEVHVHYFNKAIAHIMRDELIKQALINERIYGINFKTSILNVLDAYDITEEELNYENIRKHFNRHYKTIEKRLII